jgi:predicted phage replisome organizer
MSEIKWIKITTDIFDDEKIKIIKKLPSGDTIIVIWLELLTIAGKANTRGEIYVDVDIPYTDGMLASVLDRSESTITLALSILEKFKLITITDAETILITNWEKHQNVEGMEQAKELRRLRNQKYLQNKKVLMLEDKTSLRQEKDTLDIEEEKEEDNIITANKQSDNIMHNTILNLYHDTCISLPKVIALNSMRKKKLQARLKEHPEIEFWKDVFNKVESSDFLTGKSSNWKANFDWIFTNDTNYIKIMEGCYTKDNEVIKPVDLTHTKHRIEYEVPLEVLKRLENDRI